MKKANLLLIGLVFVSVIFFTGRGWAQDSSTDGSVLPVDPDEESSMQPGNPGEGNVPDPFTAIIEGEGEVFKGTTSGQSSISISTSQGSVGSSVRGKIKSRRGSPGRIPQTRGISLCGSVNSIRITISGFVSGVTISLGGGSSGWVIISRGCGTSGRSSSGKSWIDSWIDSWTGKGEGNPDRDVITTVPTDETDTASSDEDSGIINLPPPNNEGNSANPDTAVSPEESQDETGDPVTTSENTVPLEGFGSRQGDFSSFLGTLPDVFKRYTSKIVCDGHGSPTTYNPPGNGKCTVWIPNWSLSDSNGKLPYGFLVHELTHTILNHNPSLKSRVSGSFGIENFCEAVANYVLFGAGYRSRIPAYDFIKTNIMGGKEY